MNKYFVSKKYKTKLLEVIGLFILIIAVLSAWLIFPVVFLIVKLYDLWEYKCKQ